MVQSNENQLQGHARNKEKIKTVLGQLAGLVSKAHGVDLEVVS